MAMILVVDDDETILVSVAELLELEGFSVSTASNGLEALDRTREQQPALVLLDMRMPVLDGWAYARALSEQGLPRPKIVIMTAAHDARRWADEIGADAYVPKPFEADQLIAAVTEIVGSPT